MRAEFLGQAHLHLAPHRRVENTPAACEGARTKQLDLYLDSSETHRAKKRIQRQGPSCCNGNALTVLMQLS